MRNGTKVATFINDNKISEQVVVKAAFSSQVLFGREAAFQGRFSIRQDSIRTMDNKKWTSGLLTILMKWSSACWFNRHFNSYVARGRTDTVSNATDSTSE